ncbi:MAG: hypothetical protein M3312_00295 [Actinomycetota bacterium]|nr:hypothetical protein [Actinomycetota bacterium]
MRESCGGKQHPISRERRSTRFLSDGRARFTLTGFVFFALAALVVATGIDPILITELSVIFSAVALPLTYLPVLLAARDRRYMGEYATRTRSCSSWREASSRRSGPSGRLPAGSRGGARGPGPEGEEVA